ncbi:methyltransferase domain-containing protein [Nocardioides oleivorans]|uniref:Methyltransferase domain-containing protein n=1 Tax=Nocardioides oleivorans TaxID=273676 RepID=A0A4Q2RSN8_9ACTN|nr:bifunctional PIG-L family deacetylase/class I SAM-dependent methyltransferase [Nocardioides oleivorans]RYB92060.1 methyltransferase domain-containing protein [Nocardioides oleivorans]
MSEPTFRHDSPGTPADDWAGSPRWSSLADLRLPAGRRRLVVVGAHPDDETLGAGGLIRAAALDGWIVEVVSATAGEGSHPLSPTHSTDRLAARRRGELGSAISLLAPAATVRCLDLPDGGVADEVGALVSALVETIGTDGDEVLLCAPWRHDGHPDHEAVGRAAALAAARTDAQLLEYPVWLWHWGRIDDLPWSQTQRLALDVPAHDAKRAAVAAHASQVRPLSDQPGDEVLLGADLLAHFDRDGEVFITDTGPVDDDALDLVHHEQADPWQVDSFYERRKRAVTLASLPRQTYARALEVGCSVGALALDLAGRSDHLLALDASPAAIDLARDRTAPLPHVDVRLAHVPDEWPDGDFDLVSISEVGYFLSPRQLADVVRLATSALATDGHLLLCHWRHQPVGWPLAGPAVHDAFLAAGLEVLVEHQEPDFLLHVLAVPS